MKVDLAGHLFLNHFQRFLKQKLTLILVIQEQNITVKNVVGIMGIYLMMGHNLQARDIVITAFA